MENNNLGSRRDINADSDYKDKLLKLIPGEIVAAYLMIDGIIPKNVPHLAKWVATMTAIILIIVIPFYLIRLYRVTNKVQIVFTMGSFVIWIYSLGGPFKFWEMSSGESIHLPFIGSILLILWTLFIPLAISTPAKPSPATQSATAQGQTMPSPQA